MIADRLHFTGVEEADRLLVEDPFALLIGFALDQRVPVPKAFMGPWVLRERLGSLRPAVVAEADLEPMFRQVPAIHRFPAMMAKQVHALAEHVVDRVRRRRGARVDSRDQLRRAAREHRRAPGLREDEGQGPGLGAVQAVRRGAGGAAGPVASRRWGTSTPPRRWRTTRRPRRPTRPCGKPDASPAGAPAEDAERCEHDERSGRRRRVGRVAVLERLRVRSASRSRIVAVAEHLHPRELRPVVVVAVDRDGRAGVAPQPRDAGPACALGLVVDRADERRTDPRERDRLHARIARPRRARPRCATSALIEQFLRPVGEVGELAHAGHSPTRGLRRPSCDGPRRRPTGAPRGGPARPWRPGTRAGSTRRGPSRSPA